MHIGIDIGGTTTDIACFYSDHLTSVLSVAANDPVTSASGALGKFVTQQKVALSDIDAIAVTGVGAHALGDELFGIPLIKVDEFKAIGMGGLYLSAIEEAIVVSMGTGTAIVSAKGGEAEHLGGTGVGGGTLIGLAKYMLKITDIEALVELAGEGSLVKVDLSIGDIAAAELGNLPANATASNFGRHSDKATPSDLALGLINLVCQTIGMMAVFAARQKDASQVVLTGKLTRLPQVPAKFALLESMFGLHFTIPNNAEYATAVGAAYALARRSD
jgi:type II pantothenate kinase